MSRVKKSMVNKRIRRLIWLVLAVFVLLGYSLQSVMGSAYYSLMMQAYGTVGSPPVILEEGTAGTSTIYTNSTSAKASVEAPLFDYVDNNDPDVDSSADKGMHSNFPAQQAGPDSIYDTLAEENMEGIEDYVDNISDVDVSSDIGSHSNFENEKLKDGIYDTLTESAGEIIRDEATQGQDISATVSFGHTLGYSSGNNRLVVVAAGFENSAGDINIGSATYDGQAMTKIVQATSGGVDFVASVALFYMLDSNLPSSSGSYSVVVTADSNPSVDLWACAVSYIGVKQEAPDDYDSDSSGSPTTMTSNLICDGDGSMLVQACVVGATGSFTNSSGTTEVIEDSDINSASAVFNEKLGQDSGTRDLGCTQGSMNRGAWVGSCWAPASTDYELDIEVQFTSVIDFLPTEKLCIYTGNLGDEDLRVDYWNGTGWENLDTDLTAYSCNEYTVSLTSVNFTIGFKGGTETGDTTQDQWQIDATLLRVEGGGDKEDAVDQQSNIDGSANVGTHGNFTAQQYGPDSINDTLTEENVGAYSNSTLINAESFEGTWPPTGWTETGAWNRESNFAYDGTWSADFDGLDPGTSGDLDTPGLNCSDATAIYVSFYFREDLNVDTELQLRFWDGSVWDNIEDLGVGYSPGWNLWEMKVTDSQYFISNFQVRWDANDVESFESAYIDLVTVKKEVQSGDNYELDLEVQWTGLQYLLPNGNLSIYGGSMGAEDVKVDVWNGTGWENAFTDLSAGWNNVSITGWLTTSNFTIRFKGGTETGDPSEDTWQIDVALIHVWHDGGESYELDLEAQWTSAAYTRTNEELCIKTGTFSGSEDIQVNVRNNTGSSWHWVMNLTASQWNNVSITSYLKSSTFTVQFLGGTEIGDTNKDSWNIDATLLHVWTLESTDYVDNNTSNVDSIADKGTHGNFSAQQYGPDSINDKLTESWEGGGTVWLWQEDTSGYTPTSSFETYEFWNSWTTNSTTSGTVTKIGIYVFADPGNSPQVKLGIYDDSGGSPNNLLGETNATTITGTGWLDLEINGGGVSISASTTYHLAHITDIAPTTQWRYYKASTPVSDYRNNRVWDNLFDPAGATTKSGSYRYGAYRVGYDEPSGYRLDLEVQWTTDYTTYDELCIKTGTFNGSEDIMVYAWNVSASDWHALYNLTASSWNNVPVTDWFFNENFTVRFLGGTEGTDTYQDSWNIDVSLLHVGTPEWGAWSGELLINPSFEMGNLTGWTAKGPAAAYVEVFNATSGGDSYTNRSLRIGDYGVCTEDQPGTNDDSGVWQNVSLASYASAIDVGNAVINASAWLYPSEWDWDDVALIVRFYNSSGGFISAWNTTGEYGSGSAYYPQAWMLGQGEAHFTEGQLEKFGCYNYTMPVGTRTVGIQLGMGEHKDTFYCGGQADEASIKVRTRAPPYDYVLRVNNTETGSWQIRLKKYSDSNINRLQNCTIYFHNSSDGTSRQIYIENGAYVNQTGPWYDLGDSETIYIAMKVEATSIGTSYVRAYLEILVPNTSTYAQYVITFEIT